MEGEKGANSEHVIQNVYIAEVWQWKEGGKQEGT